MAFVFGTGISRLFYRAAKNQTGLTVTAYLWSPATPPAKSALQTFTELEGGIYYLDFNFTAYGAWAALFYENGQPTTFGVWRIEEPP